MFKIKSKPLHEEMKFLFEEDFKKGSVCKKKKSKPNS